MQRRRRHRGLQRPVRSAPSRSPQSPARSNRYPFLRQPSTASIHTAREKTHVPKAITAVHRDDKSSPQAELLAQDGDLPGDARAPRRLRRLEDQLPKLLTRDDLTRPSHQMTENAQLQGLHPQLTAIDLDVAADEIDTQW